MALFQYDAVASILHDKNRKRVLLETFEKTLHELGGEIHRVDTEILNARDAHLPLFILVLTGGTEADAMKIIAEEHMIERGIPLVLLAHPSHNSLPATLEILAKVRQLGGTGSILQASPDRTFDKNALSDVCAVATTVQALRDTRIGIVGKPSDWLIASNQSAEVAYQTWGVQCVEIHFDALSAEIKEIRAHPRNYHESHELRERAEFFREASEADIAKSMDILESLRRIAVRDNLSALTLRCFDLVLDDKSTGCLALSVLSDEGIDAGCEGDIPSIIALHWIRLLTGQVGWMSNPSRITILPDKSRAEILLAHCTSPRSTLSRYGLRSHFESGLGVAIAGIVPPGEVTIVRIGGEKLDRVWFSRARVVASPREEELCRTQAVLEISPVGAEELLSNPLGNHLVMVHGDWTTRIEAFLTLNQKIARS